MSAPNNDPLIQRLQVLVAGTGYDFYDRRNTLRADDLLVRQRAANSLAVGARALANLEVEYRRVYIPPAAREVPFPPAAEMESLRALGRLRTRYDSVASAILTMSVPTQDKTWWRFREEKALLSRLLEFDYQMLLHTEDASTRARSLTADQWHSHSEATDPSPLLNALETLIHDRAQLLQIG